MPDAQVVDICRHTLLEVLYAGGADIGVSQSR